MSEGNDLTQPATYGGKEPMCNQLCSSAQDILTKSDARNFTSACSLKNEIISQVRKLREAEKACTLTMQKLAGLHSDGLIAESDIAGHLEAHGERREQIRASNEQLDSLLLMLDVVTGGGVA